MAWLAAVPVAAIISGATTAATVGISLAQASGQKKIAEQNAKLDERAAAIEADQTARAEEALRRQNRGFFGRQRAAIAEAGLGFGGSTGMLAEQSAVLAELDAQNIRYGGRLSGQGLLSRAAMTRSEGKASKRSGTLLAGSQLLQGSGTTYGNFKAG